MATATLNPVSIHEDADGLAPGIEGMMIGRQGKIRFSGHFFAAPDVPHMQFDRAAVVVWASQEIMVLLDLSPNMKGMMYVIDRVKRLSLGCRMTADFIPD